MNKTTRPAPFAPVALLTLILVMGAACRQTPELETRTFRINNLEPWEVEPLVGPYVFTDRADQPGELSAGGQSVTVRETPDNLDKIARVLAEYDVARPDVRLHFQLIEADGFTTSDPGIAEVEAELRKIFQFRGYRLAGEATVAVTNQANFAQRLAGSNDVFEVQGNVVWVRRDQIHLADVELNQRYDGRLLRTSMNLRPGQTLVLGSSPKPGSTATLLLTVRAEPAGDL